MDFTRDQLHTSRLEMRILRIEEAQLLRRYLLDNRSHLASWEALRDEAYFSLEQCRNRLQTTGQQASEGNALHFAIFLAGSEEMLGVCNFTNIVRGVFQACHLGYAIAARHQGYGYMQEAVQAGIAHMFTRAGLHRIMANHLPENERSARLLQRLGFEREGLARSYLMINGRWRDHILNSLINPAHNCA
jgi:ribosomal-protein-alanine N-acetyltransferase